MNKGCEAEVGRPTMASRMRWMVQDLKWWFQSRLYRLAVWFFMVVTSGGNYESHADREFVAMGWPGDCEMQDMMCRQVKVLLRVFGSHGHSGSSAPYAISIFKKLAAFEPLGPLTGEDSEWSNKIDPDLWQNNRCSHVFKKENGVAYDIDGYVFWHWSERDLDADEKGYPGKSKYKASFTSNMSRRLVVFPYTPKTERVEIESFETNKDTGEREPGSGWWETVYPEAIIKENEELTVMLEEK